MFTHDDCCVHCNGMEVFKATVLSVDTVTGNCTVHVATLSGTAPIVIPPVGLPSSNGALVLPQVGDVRLVATDNNRYNFYWAVTADAVRVWETLDSTGASLGVLSASVTVLNGEMDTAQADIIAIEQALATSRRLGQVGTYRISTTTGPTPASGSMRYDTSTQTAASHLYLSHIDNNNNDIDLYLANLRPNDTIIVQDQDVSTNYQMFRITATPTGSHVLTYYDVPVTLTGSNGIGTTGFANNHVVTVSTIYTGVTPSQINHSELAGLSTGDDHPQYGLVAGETWSGTHTHGGTDNFTGTKQVQGTAARMMVGSGQALLSSSLDTTTSAQDISGCTSGSLALLSGDLVIVTGVFDVRIDTTAIVFVGTLDINGNEQTLQALYKSTDAADRTTCSQTWYYSVPSSTNYTFKLRGRTSSGATGDAFVTAHTAITWQVFR